MRTIICICFLLLANKVDAQLDSLAIAEVYQTITKSIGDIHQQWPRIQRRSQAWSVAAFRPSEHTIYIEDRALDICQSFGTRSKSALAFLIGHELTHFYQKHQWGEMGFQSSFLMSDKTFKAFREQEAEADLYGAFTAYLADYDVRPILGELLDEIYRSYALDTSSNNAYPSLSERKEVIHRVKEQVDQLIAIYETANHCLALHQYEFAARCYQYLLKFLKTEGLYYNAGLAFLKAALKLDISIDSGFSYPLVIDRQLPVRSIYSQDPNLLLHFADEYFLAALQLNDNQFDSRLGLVCSALIRDQMEKASNSLKLFEWQDLDAYSQSRFLIIQGILFAKSGQRSEAIKNWNLARSVFNQPSVEQWVEENKAKIRSKPKEQQITTRTIRFLQEAPERRFWKDAQNTLISNEDPLYPLKFSIKNDQGIRQCLLSNDLTEIGFRQLNHFTNEHGETVNLTDFYAPIEGSNVQGAFEGHTLGCYRVLWEQQIILDIQNGQIRSITAFGIQTSR